MQSYSWYQQLNKPSWSPPAWLFGPVWSILYILIAISFGYVFYLAIKKKISSNTVLPFVLNLVFNFAFTPIQFGLRNNLLAFIDIVIVLSTLIWFISVIWNKKRWIALINIPYLMWVSFATVLQLTVTLMN